MKTNEEREFLLSERQRARVFIGNVGTKEARDVNDEREFFARDVG